MTDEEAMRVGLKCVSSTLWRWLQGMRGHDEIGSFVVTWDESARPSAWPDLRHIETQQRAYWLLKNRLPEFEPCWTQQHQWRQPTDLERQGGGKYRPFARTLPELMAEVFALWPKAGQQ